MHWILSKCVAKAHFPFKGSPVNLMLERISQALDPQQSLLKTTQAATHIQAYSLPGFILHVKFHVLKDPIILCHILGYFLHFQRCLNTPVFYFVLIRYHMELFHHDYPTGIAVQHFIAPSTRPCNRIYFVLNYYIILVGIAWQLLHRMMRYSPL